MACSSLHSRPVVCRCLYYLGPVLSLLYETPLCGAGQESLCLVAALGSFRSLPVPISLFKDVAPATWLPFSLLSSTFSQLLTIPISLRACCCFPLLMHLSISFLFFFFCCLYSRSLKSCLSFLLPIPFLLISFTPSPVGFLSSTPLNLVSCSGTEPNGQFSSLL